MGNVIDYFNGDELAASVWQGKYAHEGENTPDDMHIRMAKEFARVEKEYQKKEPSTTEYLEELIRNKLSNYGYVRKNLTEEKIYAFFKDFKYIIPQGSIMSQLGAKSIGSLSNCFVIGQPEDSYGGIFQKDEELVQLMKRRGGVGIDISTLRPEGTLTTNAAKTSTGAISFMHRFSNSTREVAQNGRRGALMLSMDVNHPNILEFIKIKRDLTQVTGANISIKLNDKFMKAVEANEDYLLQFPCEGSLEQIVEIEDLRYNELKTIDYGELDCGEVEGYCNKGYVKRIKARKYWDEIIKSAHGVAEPGLMYWDRMIEYSPDGVYPQFKQVTTNPCSEIAMQPYDACRLIAVNLFSFVDNPFTDKATFDTRKFYEVNYEAMRLSDNLIDLEIEHIQKIIAKIETDPESSEVKLREATLWLKVLETATASRRTGLGFTGLGDTLAALGVKYGSEESLKVVKFIMETKMESELDCTIDLAILRGTFEGWDDDKEYFSVQKDNGIFIESGNSFYNFIAVNFQEQAVRMKEHGRRNVSWSTVAPTGSLSILAQVTSGVEPLFMPFYMRRKKVNPGEGVKIDFTDDNGDTWQEFPVLHEKFVLWYQELLNNVDNIDEDLELYTYKQAKQHLTSYTKDRLNDLFKKSPWYGATANDIPWKMRVKTQALIQKYISHSISSTVNLPEDVSLEEVSNIYMEAWRQGIKGITVYREGSRSGVLVSKDTSKHGTFEYKDAIVRPRTLNCDIHTTTHAGQKYNVIVGLLDNKPYEVFVAAHFTNKKNMQLTKVKRGRYDLEEKGLTYSEDIATEMTDEQQTITRLISIALRHGADIKFLVEQLNKSGGLFGFNKSIARVIKKYIPEGAKSTVTCKECGSEQVIFEEGCNKCLDCGNSKCG